MKIFLASSMRDELLREKRSLIDSIVKNANEYLSKMSANLRYEPIVIGETAGVSGREDSQGDINSSIGECDLFVMLLKNGEEVKDITFEEYITALSKSKSAANKKPFIKIYLLKDKQADDVNISYLEKLKNGDNNKLEKKNLEDIIYIDSRRYIDIVTSESFKEQFQRYLQYEFIDELRKFSQSEISYANHISGTTQGLVRKYKHKYFKRKGIDDKMGNILNESSLLILEGNTYSGKTCAAYELFKQEKWKDAIFYIYKCNHDASIDDLNMISINHYDSKQKVFFIDDINEIVNKNTSIDGNRQLWSELRKLTTQLPKWKNTTIVITVAGRLSQQEKIALYRKIFGENYDVVKKLLDNIIVNFDKYDKIAFKNMVNKMVKEGILHKNKIRPGNYTIGSLFINDDLVKNQLETILDEYGNEMQYTLRAIKLNWMYANNRYKGHSGELRRLYGFLCEKNNIIIKSSLEDGVEVLRSKGIVCYDNAKQNDAYKKIMIDNYVIESIDDVLKHKFPYTNDIEELIAYADKNKTGQYDERIDDGQLLFTCPEQMGYMLCEHANLDDETIIDLIKRVYCKVTTAKKPLIITDKNIAVMMGEICKKGTSQIYSKGFCATAVKKLASFDTAKSIMLEAKSLKAKAESENSIEYANIYTTLYKEIAYALISQDRHLTMHDENLILKEIFGENCAKEFNPPFDESDLKRVHILKRMIPHLDKNTLEIIELAENSNLDSDGINSLEDEMEDIPFGVEKSDIDGNDETLIEKVLLPQLRNVVISAMKRTEDFNEFQTIVERLSKTESKHLKCALNYSFATIFYNSVKDIALRYSYEDRYSLFKFILELENSESIIQYPDSKTDEKNSALASTFRVIALNTLLPLLDELGSLNAYDSMKSKKLTDGFTFSMLMKNEFLGFEHLFHIAPKDECNNLEYNQLMGKAETIDDAKACIKLIKKCNAEPSELEDEYALGRYLEIRYINHKDCIRIIKSWREKFSGKTLSPITLGVIVGKFPYHELKKLFEDPIETLGGYGLTNEEIEEIRRNAVCNQKLFYKANEREGEGEYVKNRFDKLISDTDLRDIIIDSEYNARSGIISAYMKNKELFPNYDAMKEWWDSFYSEHSSTLKITPYIYDCLLWAAQNKGDSARDEINRLLVEAYNYFAGCYGKDEVIYNMSQLYKYIIRVTKEKDMCKKIPYAYEENITERTLVEYLEQILNDIPSYADGVFVLYVLELMQNNFNEDVFNIISNIARKNRCGIKLETLNKRELSKNVKDRLLKIKDGEIYVNRDLITNFSTIKLLWWLLDTNQIKYHVAESYLEKHKEVHVTQTYLNMVFSKIYYACRNNTETYNLMKDLLYKYVTENSSALYKSIQMLLPMIKASNSTDQLNDTIKLFPKEYESSEQCIGAVMHKHISLYYNVCEKTNPEGLLATLKGLLVDNRKVVTIHHVNIYLRALMQIYRDEIKSDDKCKNMVYEPIKKCYEKVYNENHVDVNELLNLTGDEWILSANVQTYIYFLMFDSKLPVYIDEKFKGNYSYDKGKNCLFDCIKNYSLFYPKGYDLESVEVFARALDKKKYENVRKCLAILLDADKTPISEFYSELAKKIC